jgi:tetratricopeptide (TPR) repeat protein
MRIASTLLAPVLLSIVVVGAAGAQDQCQLEESRFGRQLLAIQQARGAANADQATRTLTGAIRDLASRNDYPAERAYFLAQAYTVWIGREDLSHQATRGQLGLPGDAAEALDLEQQIDSLFTAVEAARPGCAENIRQLRRSDAWVRLIQAAIQQYQAEQLDEAEVTARRSIRLFAGVPYAHNVLAGIAQSRGQLGEALQHLRESVGAAEGDTLFTEVYQQSLFGIGSISGELADLAEGAARDEHLRESRDAYERLLASAGVADDLAAAARQGMARGALVTGDTAAVQALYAPQLQNPDAYDYRSLLVAGSVAAEIGRINDAIRLLEVAQAKNPYHRDVLANLVFLYARSDDPGKGIPVAERLLNVDPANRETLRLVSQAYSAVARSVQGRARALADRGNRAPVAARPPIRDSLQVLNDSIPKINELAVRHLAQSDSLNGRVTISNMGVVENQVTVRGSIENTTQSAATYATTIELLDASGSVVGRQDVSVGPIRPGAAERFTVELQAPGAMAVRYTSLTRSGQ